MIRNRPATAAFVSTLWFAAGGLLGGTLSYAASEVLVSGIRLSVWHHSFSLSLLYGLVLALSANLPLAVRNGRPAVSWPRTIAAIAIAAAVTTPTVVGAFAGAGMSATTIGLTLLTRRVLRRDPLDQTQLAPLEALMVAMLSATVVGGAWVVWTAPTYAEGFLVMTWAILALGHFLVLVLPALITRFTSTAATRPYRTRKLGAAGLAGAAILTATGCLGYAIITEGMQSPPLEPPTEWPAAFLPLRDPTVTTDSASPRRDVFRKVDLVELLLRSDPTAPAQVATLFLLTGEHSWAWRFKRELLDQVALDSYTGAEGSVKYGQRYAMLWAMYYREVSRRDPDLFSKSERDAVTAWLLRVARAQFHPGWVDYLYAMPFRDDPDGPYLNQEIGAGLAATLNSFVQASDDADLKAKFRRFLAGKAVGWRRNFRNQDDSLEYQDVWMGSAHALFRYADNLDPARGVGMKFGVEWLKRQLPPPPERVNYGLPNTFRPIDTLAMGAFLLGDPESKALLDAHLAAIRDHSERLPSQLTALWLWRDDVPSGPRPQPSIRLDGPTGYAFRPGALEPDKVVLRNDGWDRGEGTGTFALSNLRNAGWHRYPATNTLIRLSHDGKAWAAEDIVVKMHHWLPAGRATHRDKKVDRSRLNGVTMERTGLDAWIGGMTGIYSRWRQDAPHFARPGFIGTLGDFQAVQTMIDNWDGLYQERWQLLCPAGGLLVVDRVHDHSDRDKALFWHLTDQVRIVDLPGQGQRGAKSSKTALRLFSSPEHAVAAIETPWQNRSRPADPDAEISHRVQVSSRARSFAAAAYFAAGTAMPLDTVLLPADGPVPEQRLGKGSGERTLVLGSGQEWHLEGIRSDAAAAYLTRQADGLDAVLQQPSLIEITRCSRLSRVLLDGNEVVPLRCDGDRLVLPFKERRPPSGRTLSLHYNSQLAL